jgi:hypothetical protein
MSLDLATLLRCMSPRDQRLFACDCAERALAREPQIRGVDPRLAVAVTMAWRYTRGLASQEDLAAARAAAARAARWCEPYHVSLSAAVVAATTADAAVAAASAAEHTARAVAEAEARGLDGCAAWTAFAGAMAQERAWQLSRALTYISRDQ